MESIRLSNQIIASNGGWIQLFMTLGAQVKKKVISRPWVNNEIKTKAREHFKVAQIRDRKLVAIENTLTTFKSPS